MVPRYIKSTDKFTKDLQIELSLVDKELIFIWDQHHSEKGIIELQVEKQNAEIIIKEIQFCENQFQEIKNALSHGRKQRAHLQHLEKFFIRDAKLKNISPAIISSLASYGIETAADVRLKSHIKVPSVGIDRSLELRLWVTKIETQFVYQSNGKDDAIENKLYQKSK